MAKRFVDTALGRKKWFRLLTPKMKCAWRFLCDECDHAGIWDIDEDAFAYYIGEPVSIAEIVDAFGDKIEVLKKDNKIFVRGFIDFQYATLNPENRVHKSVLDRLGKLKIKHLRRALQGTKDTDTETDTETDTDQLPFVATCWNSTTISLPKVKTWNDDREKALKDVRPSNVNWTLACEKVEASDFLTGRKGGEWRATFDWLLDQKTLSKVLEGNYDSIVPRSSDGGLCAI